MKEMFVEPEVELIELDGDVIATSDCTVDDCDTNSGEYCMWGDQ